MIGYRHEYKIARLTPFILWAPGLQSLQRGTLPPLRYGALQGTARCRRCRGTFSRNDLTILGREPTSASGGAENPCPRWVSEKSGTRDSLSIVPELPLAHEL